MRIYRLLVEIGPGVWSYVVAAPDHVEAWRAVIKGLSRQERSLASQEELEALGPVETLTERPYVVSCVLSSGRALVARPREPPASGQARRSA